MAFDSIKNQQRTMYVIKIRRPLNYIIKFRNLFFIYADQISLETVGILDSVSWLSSNTYCYWNPWSSHQLPPVIIQLSHSPGMHAVQLPISSFVLSTSLKMQLSQNHGSNYALHSGYCFITTVVLWTSPLIGLPKQLQECKRNRVQLARL